MKKNLFIAFEGIDGSGKSTQVKLLSENLQKAGHKVHSTFEPTSSPIGKMIRDIFSNKMQADHKTIAGLFVADRLHHLLNKEDGILQKIHDGYTVISDRYYFSSYAYHAAHMPMDWVIAANAMSADLLRPDVNIYIDIKPEISMERLAKGRDTLELYETLENQKKVYEKYFEAFEKLKTQENIFITDGNKLASEIAAHVWKKIELIINTNN